MQASEPTKEHVWLKKLLGDWKMTSEASMGPDQPPIKNEGTESVSGIGEYWVQGVGKFAMPDGALATMQLTLGFDAPKGRFVGTWIGSMMPYLWIYDGELDAAGTTLTLNSDGPSMAGDGSMAKYQDIIEFLSDDHRTLSSQVLGADVQWTRFMTAHYHRS